MRALPGDMLLALKQPAEGQDEFGKLLNCEPNRFAAVYGAARAAEMNGDHEAASEMYRKLGELGVRGSMDRDELK